MSRSSEGQCNMCHWKGFAPRYKECKISD